MLNCASEWRALADPAGDKLDLFPPKFLAWRHFSRGNELIKSALIRLARHQRRALLTAAKECFASRNAEPAQRGSAAMTGQAAVGEKLLDRGLRAGDSGHYCDEKKETGHLKRISEASRQSNHPNV